MLGEVAEGEGGAGGGGEEMMVEEVREGDESLSPFGGDVGFAEFNGDETCAIYCLGEPVLWGGPCLEGIPMGECSCEDEGCMFVVHVVLKPF